MVLFFFKPKKSFFLMQMKSDGGSETGTKKGKKKWNAPSARPRAM